MAEGLAIGVALGLAVVLAVEFAGPILEAAFDAAEEDALEISAEQFGKRSVSTQLTVSVRRNASYDVGVTDGVVGHSLELVRTPLDVVVDAGALAE